MATKHPSVLYTQLWNRTPLPSDLIRECIGFLPLAIPLSTLDPTLVCTEWFNLDLDSEVGYTKLGRYKDTLVQSVSLQLGPGSFVKTRAGLELFLSDHEISQWDRLEDHVCLAMVEQRVVFSCEHWRSIIGWKTIINTPNSCLFLKDDQNLSISNGKFSTAIVLFCRVVVHKHNFDENIAIPSVYLEYIK